MSHKQPIINRTIPQQKRGIGQREKAPFLKRIVWACTLLCVLPVTVLGADGDVKCATEIQTCLDKKLIEYHGTAWLGTEIRKLDKGYYSKIERVVPDSPAAAVGFQVGDILIAINGIELSRKNQAVLKELKNTLKVGSRVTYTVKRGGYREAYTATLAKPPAGVIAAWLGEHMMTHHTNVEFASL